MTMLLAACVTGRSEEPLTQLRCPPLASYSKDEQKKLGEELSQLPPGSSLPRAMVDYSKLRDACRAINKAR